MFHKNMAFSRPGRLSPFKHWHPAPFVYNIPVMLWILASLFLCTAARAGTLSITPFFEKGAGSLAYQLESRDSSTQIDNFGNHVFAFVQSELEYPLDQFNAGLRLDYRRDSALAGRALHAFGGAFTRLSQPKGRMKDSDWIGAEAQTSSGFSSTTSRMRQRFSYTESEQKILYYGAIGGVSLSLFKFFGKPAHLGLTCRYSHFYSDIFGISGWQSVVDSQGYLDPENEIHFDTLQGVRVLTYEVDFFTAAITTRLPLIRNRNLAWDLDLEFAPLSLARDEDDHLLRGKRINAETYGISFLSETRLVLFLSPIVHLEARSGFRYIRNSGDMEQLWYRDETYDGEIVVPQGTRLTEIPAKFISLTGWLSVGLTLNVF